MRVVFWGCTPGQGLSNTAKAVTRGQGNAQTRIQHINDLQHQRRRCHWLQLVQQSPHLCLALAYFQRMRPTISSRPVCPHSLFLF